MSVITVSRLSKHFSIFNKEPGLAGSMKSLFHRRYSTVRAVENISFDISKGELIGFIGPNGAGKTTTLKCLSGLLYPSSGDISVLGFTPSQRLPGYLRQIGFVMGQKNQLWWDLPPQETFLLNKAIYEISDEDYRRRLNFFISELDLNEIISVQTKKLSLGQRMKAELVAALLHWPKVVFLDEPTIGLDVVYSQKIRKFIKNYNRRRRATIILTSHNMDDVREMASRVIIIDRGCLHYDGSLKTLVSRYSQNKILKFTFSSEVDLKSLAKYGRLTPGSGIEATLTVKKSAALKTAAKILADYPVTDLNIEETPIEDIIRTIFKNHHVST